MNSLTNNMNENKDDSTTRWTCRYNGIMDPPCLYHVQFKYAELERGKTPNESDTPIERDNQTGISRCLAAAEFGDSEPGLDKYCALLVESDDRDHERACGPPLVLRPSYLYKEDGEIKVHAVLAPV